MIIFNLDRPTTATGEISYDDDTHSKSIETDGLIDISGNSTLLNTCNGPKIFTDWGEEYYIELEIKIDSNSNQEWLSVLHMSSVGMIIKSFSIT